jgi:hypothetical protein
MILIAQYPNSGIFEVNWVICLWRVKFTRETQISNTQWIEIWCLLKTTENAYSELSADGQESLRSELQLCKDPSLRSGWQDGGFTKVSLINWLVLTLSLYWLSLTIFLFSAQNNTRLCNHWCSGCSLIVWVSQSKKQSHFVVAIELFFCVIPTPKSYHQ